MTNKMFCLLTEKEKNKKFRTILKKKTNGLLTEEELRIILTDVSPNKQYNVAVYWDNAEFTRILTANSNYHGKTILGQAFVGSMSTPGERFCTTRATAVMIESVAENNTILNQLHIFIPEGRIQKGN